MRHYKKALRIKIQKSIYRGGNVYSGTAGQIHHQLKFDPLYSNKHSLLCIYIYKICCNKTKLNNNASLNVVLYTHTSCTNRFFCIQHFLTSIVQCSAFFLYRFIYRLMHKHTEGKRALRSTLKRCGSLIGELIRLIFIVVEHR